MFVSKASKTNIWVFDEKNSIAWKNRFILRPSIVILNEMVSNAIEKATDLFCNSFGQILRRFCFSSSSWTFWSTAQVQLQSTKKGSKIHKITLKIRLRTGY